MSLSRAKAACPPRLAVRMLETLLPEESREVVIGDLTENYELAAPRGRMRAGFKFWLEALGALVQLQILPDRVPAFIPTTESPVQSFLSDLRQAARVLLRARGFVALCVLTLGLAIGAATVIFSVANPVVLQAVPYPDADRLVIVNERATDGRGMNVGYATYADLRVGARSLEHSAAVGTWEPTLFGEHDAERLNGLRVSWEYFRTLGVRPALGRDFLQSEDTPDTYNVVILSHGLWTRRFGADPDIIGKPLDMGTVHPVVVGVMPASYEDVLDPTSQIWRVLGYRDQEYACRSCRHLRMVARLRPDVTMAAAAKELNLVMQRMAALFPDVYRGAGTVVEGMQDRVTRNTRAIFAAIVGAVVLLLLIAIANVANLQLARAARRREEFAVRSALGAGRGRIAQQLLAEGLLIALMGGVAGVVLAGVVLPALVAQLPASLPRLASVRLDWTVLAMVACVVLVVALVMGMLPVAQAGRRSLFDAIRGGGRSGVGTHHRTRATLVVAEVALAMMLVIGASLLGRSLMQLLSVDMGFDPANLVTMQVQASGTAYQTNESVFANHDRIRAAVQAVPGVESVGLTSQLPLGGGFDRYGIRDRDNPGPDAGADADRYTVSFGFVRSMRTPVIRGRAFTEAETRDSAVHVALVGNSLARRMWPAGDALGKYIMIGGGDGRPYFRIVGIMADIRHAGLDEAEPHQVYVPERQWVWADEQVTLVVRVSGDAAHMIAPIREAVRSVDPLQPVARVMTMEQVVARSTGQRRIGLFLFAAFGGMALLLAAAGIYGVLSNAVVERTREFGVRAALGATPGSIVGLVLREGAALALAGLLIGTAAALLLSRYLQALLYGVSPTDMGAVMAGAGIIIVVAMAACLAPARRATRTDPMTALRAE